MKITMKKLLLPINIIFFRLVTIGIAYAATSFNFFKRAALWVTKNRTNLISTSA
jgi:hypothetical protein